MQDFSRKSLLPRHCEESDSDEAIQENITNYKPVGWAYLPNIIKTKFLIQNRAVPKSLTHTSMRQSGLIMTPCMPGNTRKQLR